MVWSSAAKGKSKRFFQELYLGRTTVPWVEPDTDPPARRMLVVTQPNVGTGVGMGRQFHSVFNGRPDRLRNPWRQVSRGLLDHDDDGQLLFWIRP